MPTDNLSERLKFVKMLLPEVKNWIDDNIFKGVLDVFNYNGNSIDFDVFYESCLDEKPDGEYSGFYFKDDDGWNRLQLGNILFKNPNFKLLLFEVVKGIKISPREADIFVSGGFVARFISEIDPNLTGAIPKEFVRNIMAKNKNAYDYDVYTLKDSFRPIEDLLMLVYNEASMESKGEVSNVVLHIEGYCQIQLKIYSNKNQYDDSKFSMYLVDNCKRNITCNLIRNYRRQETHTPKDIVSKFDFLHATSVVAYDTCMFPKKYVTHSSRPFLYTTNGILKACLQKNLITNNPLANTKQGRMEKLYKLGFS